VKLVASYLVLVISIASTSLPMTMVSVMSTILEFYNPQNIFGKAKAKD